MLGHSSHLFFGAKHMKIAISLLISAALLAGAAGAGKDLVAQEASDAPMALSLQAAIDRALEANPTLRAQQAKAEARAQLPLQASPAFLPSLELGLQGMKTTDPVAVFGLKLRQENFAAEDLALDALNRPDAYSGYNATATVEMPLLAPEGIFGFQAARKAAEAAGFPPNERQTGGRAVAYTGTTVAVAHARPNADFRTGVGERYEETLQAIQRALWRLDVPAQQGEPADAFCPGGHSLQWKGKIAGVAQRVKKDVALVGAVVVVDDHGAIADVLAPVYDALDVPFDPDSVGSVERAGGRADPDAVVEEVEAVFLEVQGLDEGDAEVEEVEE